MRKRRDDAWPGGPSFTPPRPPPAKEVVMAQYRGTSLIRSSLPLGPYRRAMPRALWWSQGGEAVSHEGSTPVLELAGRAWGTTFSRLRALRAWGEVFVLIHLRKLPRNCVLSSYTKVYSVIYDSGLVPDWSILSPLGTSPSSC